MPSTDTHKTGFTRSHAGFSNGGFTLLELIVAVGIFTIIAVAAVGGLASVIDANRRTRSVTKATNNLNFALQNMVRGIRSGYSYGCDKDDPDNAGSCTDGVEEFGFVNTDQEEIGYYLNNGRVYKTTASDDFPITPELVNINKLQFYVTGAEQNDQQSRAMIVIQGSAGTSSTAGTIKLQTTATQRALSGS